MKVILTGKWSSQWERKRIWHTETETQMRHPWWDLITQVLKKKKQLWRRGWGKEGEKKQNKAAQYIKGKKNEQIRGDTLYLQIALSNVLKSFFSFLPEGVVKKTLDDHTLKVYAVLHSQTHLFLFSFSNTWRTLNDANNTFINIY